MRQKHFQSNNPIHTLITFSVVPLKSVWASSFQFATFRDRFGVKKEVFFHPNHRFLHDTYFRVFFFALGFNWNLFSESFNSIAAPWKSELKMQRRIEIVLFSSFHCRLMLFFVVNEGNFRLNGVCEERQVVNCLLCSSFRLEWLGSDLLDRFYASSCLNWMKLSVVSTRWKLRRVKCFLIVTFDAAFIWSLMW